MIDTNQKNDAENTSSHEQLLQLLLQMRPGGASSAQLPVILSLLLLQVAQGFSLETASSQLAHAPLLEDIPGTWLEHYRCYFSTHESLVLLHLLETLLQFEHRFPHLDDSDSLERIAHDLRLSMKPYGEHVQVLYQQLFWLVEHTCPVQRNARGHEMRGNTHASCGANQTAKAF